MLGNHNSSGNPEIRVDRRGMTVAIAAVVMAVIVIIGGVGTFAALNSLGASKTTKTSCAPVTACGQSSATNDVTLFIPYTVGAGQTYAQVAAGASVPATVGVTGSETVKSFQVTWAPGQTTTGPTGSFAYTYASPGLYTVFANVTTASGAVHTGTGNLIAIKVNPSAPSIGSGYFPAVSVSLTNGSGGPYPWIGAGGSVTVNGSYSVAPADGLYSTVAPTLTVPAGAVQSALISGPSFASAKYTFANPGYFPITLVAPVTGPTGTVYQNYTWGVYVGATAAGLGCAACKAPQQSSPHPNTIVSYSIAAGGALTLDPAADYYSVGYEVDQAIDESLVLFNGTDSGQSPSNFVPEAATCVPGSPQCAALYGGNTLVQGSNYTFAIDPAAHFYNPYSGKSREVYPSDVMFSIIRAILYTQVETGTGYYVGFDIAGPLIPYAGLSPSDVSPTWDLGPGAAPIHYPYNNTPFWTFNAFAVNDTAYCPAAAMAANGCITLHADADGVAWPALLQILSIISVDGIQEAGWYTSQGANVPGFICSSANPDLPCLLPGGVTSTTNPAFEAAVTAMAPTAWDPEENAGYSGYPDPVPAVGFSEVGSGPYYLAYANPGVGYVLKANPSYQPPSGCKGQVGCLPDVGGYVPNVIRYWGSDDTIGISEVEAGYADTASFESSHYPLLLSLIQNGQFGLINFPTTTTTNLAFNLHINVALLASYDTNPINLPADAFSYEGLRATLEYAYPYLTAQSAGNVISGVDLGNPFGGFLPSSEPAFYDAKVPWPNYNNVTGQFGNPNVGSASTPGTSAWYWAQATTAGTPLYDPELAAFSSSNPLIVPVIGFVVSPGINAQEMAWGNSVTSITGGVIKFQQILLPSAGEEYTYLSPGQVPWTIWWIGWGPDYPAPVNNWQGAYGPGLWGSADALYQTLAYDDYGGDFNDSTCGHSNPTLVNMEYWANYPNQVIPQICQGTALNVTTYFANQATYTSDLATATQDWNLVQAVYNNLQLTIGIEQRNVAFSFAPWINPSTINQNSIIGGGSEWYWPELGGNGLA
jgi:hypothetical protein